MSLIRREYDVLSPEDPAQTFSFLPSAPTSGSRFSAVDPLSRYATSFSFSPFSTSDFGPSVIHVLCANGDVHTMGPIIPLHAEVPIEWIQALRLTLEREDFGQAAREWVDDLIKQVRDEEDRMERERGVSDDAMSRTASRRGSLGPAYNHSDDKNEVEEGKVRLRPPHLTTSGGPAPGRHAPLARRGPIAYDPAPEEIGADIDEDIASDICLFDAGGEQVVMAVAWAGGRVDLGVLVDSPVPKWHDPKVSEQPIIREYS